MKNRFIPIISLSIFISGCHTPPPKTLNTSGKEVKFISPVLGKNKSPNATYVLLEKNIADGKYKIVSISKIRQNITNSRQERVAFTADTTGYAPDFTHYEFRTYEDPWHYGEKTIVMECSSKPQKIEKYSPCNSEFSRVFVPYGVLKESNAGRMSEITRRSWDNPEINRMRSIDSPRWALKEAGVFNIISEIENAK